MVKLTWLHFFHHAAIPVFGSFNGTLQGSIILKNINTMLLSLIMPANACF
jgi:ascorbate-specific PTS system EIIC-type component UlaA